MSFINSIITVAAHAPCPARRHRKNMAAYLNRLHHISLHVSNANKIAYELVSQYKFNLFAARLSGQSRQLAFRKGAAVFVVNERPNQPPLRLNEPPTGITDRHSFDLNRDNVGKCGGDRHVNCLYDVTPHYSVDSACNVCFEVEDVERSFKVLRDHGCDFLVPPTAVQDDRGLVTYMVVKSIVGNVCHTLIDRTKYKGSFLPGFETVSDSSLDDTSCPVTHFDHITYACSRKATPQVMQWYQRLFGFRRFFIDR